MFKKLKHYKKRIQEGRLTEITSELLWMCQYIRKYWVLVVVFTLLTSSSSLLSLGTTMVSRNLVDAVTGYNSMAIAGTIASYIGVGLGQIAINMIRNRISLKVSLRITNGIRIDIFKKIMFTDWEALSAYRSGDLLYRINGDAGMIANSILTFIPNIVSVFISFGGAFWIMLQNDWIMACIALCGAPISLFMSRYTMRKSREYMRKNQDFSSNRMVFDQETFQNLQMIKAFDLVPRFVSQYETVQEQAVIISLEQNKYQSISTMITSLTGQLIGYSCYGYAIYRLWQGDISYGTMTMFVGMAASLRGSFSSVINLMPSLLRSCIHAERIIEIISLPREEQMDSKEALAIKEKAKHTGVEIRMKDVTFWYTEGRTVYENACLEAFPGEVIGLMGTTGKGKTTTLNLLLGLFHIRTGSLKIGNPGDEPIDISSGTRCLFSYIPQGNTLFNGTIADNLRMVKPDATDEEIIRALKMSCAWEFVKDTENGIDTEVRELGRRFSEGQKQRLSIARALLVDAPVLLLDEATSALDMKMERTVLSNIIKNEPNRTLIVASHRPSVFAMCNRVYEVMDGTIHQADQEEIERFLHGDDEYTFS